jgi:hypothetical protein
VDECAEEMETQNLIGLNDDEETDGKESDDEEKKPASFSMQNVSEFSQMSDALQEMMVKIQSTGHAALDRASAQMGDAIYNIRKFLRDKKLEENAKRSGKQTSLVGFFSPNSK